MFASSVLARRIERAEVSLTSDLAPTLARRYPADRVFVRPLGGGRAVFGGVGSPVSKMIGMGFDGPLDERELDLVEHEWCISWRSWARRPASSTARRQRPSG